MVSNLSNPRLISWAKGISVPDLLALGKAFNLVFSCLKIGLLLATSTLTSLSPVLISAIKGDFKQSKALSNNSSSSESTSILSW